jgi:CBS domain-containing protein
MRNRTVADIMTAPAVTAPADISIGGISSILIEKEINRLPILDDGGRAVSIVTRSDLVNAFCILG